MRPLGWALIHSDRFPDESRKSGHHGDAMNIQTERRSYEDTARKWPSASQGEEVSEETHPPTLTVNF